MEELAEGVDAADVGRGVGVERRPRDVLVPRIRRRGTPRSRRWSGRQPPRRVIGPGVTRGVGRGVVAAVAAGWVATVGAGVGTGVAVCLGGSAVQRSAAGVAVRAGATAAVAPQALTLSRHAAIVTGRCAPGLPARRLVHAAIITPTRRSVVTIASPRGRARCPAGRRAGKGNRTLTPLRAQRPERCVSTSSTTPASDGGHRS